jgi:hypothetical protein
MTKEEIIEYLKKYNLHYQRHEFKSYFGDINVFEYITFPEYTCSHKTRDDVYHENELIWIRFADNFEEKEVIKIYLSEFDYLPKDYMLFCSVFKIVKLNEVTIEMLDNIYNKVKENIETALYNYKKERIDNV